MQMQHQPAGRPRSGSPQVGRASDIHASVRRPCKVPRLASRGSSPSLDARPRQCTCRRSLPSDNPRGNGSISSRKEACKHHWWPWVPLPIAALFGRTLLQGMAGAAAAPPVNQIALSAAAGATLAVGILGLLVNMDSISERGIPLDLRKYQPTDRAVILTSAVTGAVGGAYYAAPSVMLPLLISSVAAGGCFVLVSVVLSSAPMGMFVGGVATAVEQLAARATPGSAGKDIAIALEPLDSTDFDFTSSELLEFDKLLARASGEYYLTNSLSASSIDLGASSIDALRSKDQHNVEPKPQAADQQHKAAAAYEELDAAAKGPKQRIDVNVLASDELEDLPLHQQLAAIQHALNAANRQARTEVSQLQYQVGLLQAISLVTAALAVVLTAVTVAGAAGLI